jgi:hypothetical protein
VFAKQPLNRLLGCQPTNTTTCCTSTVAPAQNDEENRKFVIMTKRGPRLYEAMSTKERDGWVAALNQIIAEDK